MPEQPVAGLMWEGDLCMTAYLGTGCLMGYVTATR